MSTKSEDNVGRNAAITGLASLVVRLSGLLREIIFAAVFGAGLASDAYNAAFRAAQFFRELVAEGSLSNAFVPIFSRIDEEEGAREAFRLANAFLGALLIALGAITLLTFAFAEGWIWLFASGFADDPDKFALSVWLTRILSPFVAFMSLAAVFMGMLNVRGRFFLPAVAPAMFNLAVIVGCLASDPISLAIGQPPIVVVAIASLVGGIGQFAIQLPALRADGFRIRPRLVAHPALKRLVRFLVPAFIGITTVQFALLVESQIASQFGDGPVSYLFYAFRLVQLPVGTIASSVAVATLVQLSSLVARGERDRLAGEISDALTLNSFLVLPAAVGLFVLAEPIIALTFERGAFTPEDTAMTAQMLRMYALATWGICTHRLAVPCYYALGDPYFPMRIAVVLMILKVPIALGLVYTLELGPPGLPLSHAVLVMFECAALLWGFTRRVGPLGWKLYTEHARILVASAIMGVAVTAMVPYAEGFGVVAVSAAGAVVYFAAALMLGISATRKVLARILRPGRRGLPPTVDEETREALHTLAGSALGTIALDGEGALDVVTDTGAFRFTARGGLLVGSRTGDGDGDGEPIILHAVMRIGGGPPMLHGLLIGEQAFRAQGDRIEAGRAAGPALPVAAQR
ncbi:MAG: putative peptidoglycan lipid II flippase [Myxococcota bacterium]|jgi:putative peptidoglycan lipid II flippase